MGFGNFLRGIGAALVPGGKSYGDYNPPRKKKPEDDREPSGLPASSAPNPSRANPQIQIQTQRPENLFAGLQNNLALPGAPKTAIPVNNQDFGLPSQPPQPGTVIKPQASTSRKPGYVPPTTPGSRGMQDGWAGTYTNNGFVRDAPEKKQDNRFWQKVGRGFKTAGETAVGTVANVPEVGLAAVRAGSGLVQGAAHLPSLATHAVTYVPRKIAGDDSAVNRVLSSVNHGVDTATSVVDKPFDFVNRNLDKAAQGYETHVPMAAGGAEAYRATQVPLNVLAGLLTLGGSTAAEGGANAGRVEEAGNFLTRALNRPLTSNADNVVARTAQSVSNRTAPVVNAVNSPFSAGKNVITRFLGNSRVINPAERDLIDAGEAGVAAEDVGAATGQTTQIPVTQQGGNVPIPVNTPRPGGIIREVGGDARTPGVLPTPEEAAAARARNAFDTQAPGRPDSSVGGVVEVPRPKPFTVDAEAAASAQGDVVDQYASFLKDMGEGNGTQLVPDGEGGYIRTSNNYRGGANKGKRMTKQDWRDQAEADLKAGKAEPGHQKAFDEANNPEVQSLLNQGDQTAEAPIGRPIAVKEVRGIPVRDESGIPIDRVGTPGQVRVTEAKAPMNAKTAEVAAETPPPILPPETQAILDNPKQFNKRQVAAARNQAKLAKAKAKADEATAAAIDRSLSAKPTGDKGFVQTGEYTKGRNGNVTEVTHRASEAAQGAHDTANLSVSDVLDTARQEINDNGVVSPETTRNLKAIRDSGKLDRTSPEFKAINDEYKNAISHHARALSMTDRTARTTSTGDQLANRFVSKIITFAEDSGKLTDAHIKQVTDAETAFTEARDAATAAGERFKATGSEGDFQAWKVAQEVAQRADRQAKITEFMVSKDVLKGNKSLEAAKAVQDAEKNAGVYSMDSIDANMLSGTGTMVRNFINTLFPRVENKLFGRISSRAVKPIATVGGSSGRGERIGASIGKDLYKADIGARKEAGVGFIRRTVTAGNTVGERNIQAVAHSKAFDHYIQLLKEDGYTGAELKNRAEFNVRTDPDGLVAQYEKDALQANALSSLTHTKKIENVLADGIQKVMAGAGFGNKGQQAGRFGAKAVTRVGLGFPTVIAKSLAEGFKRATLGIPEAGWSTAKFLNTGNKEAYAAELSKAIQHAGSGGGIILLGHQLGRMGVISGAYPSDPDERKRWEAEGRQENSIKIGGQWFNIPGYLGGFALPLMLGATTAGGDIKDEASLKNAWSTVLAASPVDSLQSTLDIVTGNGSDSKIKNAVTSLARAATPAGSFVAELAKLTDRTKNDTSTKDAVHNILDNIAGGIPFLNNKVNTIDKTDSFGNVLHNPNPVATVLGAQGSEQNQGKADVATAQTGANDSVGQLKDAGVLDNKTLMGLVDKKLAAKISSGQTLTPEEVTKVQKSVTKGVSATDDNNWRENGDYQTDKVALKAKLQLLESDPTAKKSEKDMLNAQMTRDDVLTQNKIPYDDLKQYQSTELTEWRKMGDPEADEYDPDTFQKLWAIDEALTKAGVSYKKGDMTKPKYSAKEAGKGRGGGNSASSMSSDFGRLKAGVGAPDVQQYQSLDQSSGSIPNIQIERPNIVHKIGSSG